MEGVVKRTLRVASSDRGEADVNGALWRSMTLFSCSGSGTQAKGLLHLRIKWLLAPHTICRYACMYNASLRDS